MTYLIKNGLVYDGSGAVPEIKDVLLKDGVISEVRKQIECEDAEIIDATGYCVTPGFVDIHRHPDISVFTDSEFGKTELLQGITTTIAGNCGLAPVPTTDETRKEMEDYLQPVIGVTPENLYFPTYESYVEKLEKTQLPINMGFLAGSDSIKVAVKGFGKEPYAAKELAQASQLVDTAMKNGAFGASLGIMYLPECYSSIDELTEVVRPVSDYDGILCTHIRGEGDSLVSSVKEVIEIARRSGVRLNISHFKATGIKNWGCLIDEAIKEIEKAQKEGVDVTVDFYPYDGGSTTLQSLIPPSLMGVDLTSTVKNFSTAEGKKNFCDKIYQPTPGWDNMALSIGWDRILICSVTHEKNRFMQGRDMASISKELGYADPAEFCVDLFVEERGMVGIIVLSMSEEDIDKVARLPYSALISDALYGGGNPHPRLLGAFPRFLRVYAKEKGVLSYEEAIHKMTALPAKRIHLKDRGILGEGKIADVLIFKKDEFIDCADYSGHSERAKGMEYVFLNGNIAVRKGEVINRKQGKFLRLDK